MPKRLGLELKIHPASCCRSAPCAPDSAGFADARGQILLAVKAYRDDFAPTPASLLALNFVSQGRLLEAEAGARGRSGRLPASSVLARPFLRVGPSGEAAGRTGSTCREKGRRRWGVKKGLSPSSRGSCWAWRPCRTIQPLVAGPCVDSTPHVQTYLWID